MGKDEDKERQERREKIGRSGLPYERKSDENKDKNQDEDKDKDH